MVFFWSQTRGGPIPQKSQNYLFLGKIFKSQGGGPDPRSPPLDPRMARIENLALQSRSNLHEVTTSSGEIVREISRCSDQ